MNRTLVGEVQALCTATVLDQQTWVSQCERRVARAIGEGAAVQRCGALIQTELARSLELRSGAYHAPALPVELYQRSWRGDTITPTSQHQACRGPRFERRSRTYEARALPTELHQHKTLEVAERIALPHDLLSTPPNETRVRWGPRLCRQTPFCLGYATSKIWSGVRELHPCFRTGDPGYCSYTNSALVSEEERYCARTLREGFTATRCEALI